MAQQECARGVHGGGGGGGGVWRVACGVWRAAGGGGGWRVACGVWRVADWRTLRDCAAVELACRNKVVARLHECQQRVHLRALARCHGERVGQGRSVVVVTVRLAWCALQLSHLVLEHMRRRVHDTRVNRAQLREPEQRRGVLGALELERCRLEDRNCARPVVRVKLVAVVERYRRESLLVLVGVDVALVNRRRLRVRCGINHPCARWPLPE